MILWNNKSGNCLGRKTIWKKNEKKCSNQRQFSAIVELTKIPVQGTQSSHCFRTNFSYKHNYVLWEHYEKS